MKKIKQTFDGFKNIIKGLGDPDKDPRMSTTFTRGKLITQQIANDLYVYNWIAAKGVNIPIDDATRKWRNLLIKDPEEKKEVEDIMSKFDVKGKINLAMKWARVFGGSVIIIVIDGEDPEEPLDIERIRPDSLKNLIVLDRYNIHPGTIDRNILSDNYGSPEYYMVHREGQVIHSSRVLKFDNETTTLLESERNNFWGLSIFTKTWDAIADAGTMIQGIGNLVSEASVDVYKIKDLNALVAQGKDSVVINRLKLAHKMKSVINGIALDADDDYDKKASVFNTLPDIDDRYMQKVSGAFDIPLTRFLGISPSGLNATGDSDMKNYYDNVQSTQENDIRPKLNILDSVIMASAGIKETLEYDFYPLHQLSETEQAEVDTKNKDRDIAYVDAGIIRESDVLANLAENGTYVTIDEIRVEKEIEEEELNLEFEEEQEENENSIANQEPEGAGNPVSEGTE